MPEQSKSETSVFVGRVHGAVARICFGRADRVRAVRGGAVHVYGPRRVVGYLIVGAGVDRCYVFRAGRCGEDDPLAARVVGVSPAVRVLITAMGRRSCRRVVRLLETLSRAQVNVEQLPDEFFLRAAAARDRYLGCRDLVCGRLREAQWQR